MNEAVNLPAKLVRRLKDAAKKAATAAYAPYSKFKVGAAALTSEGDIFVGCNIENSSYGLTICAERTAVFSAVAAGRRRIVAIAVHFADVQPPHASARPSVNTYLPPPCGACLQVLSEFSANATVILTGRWHTQVLTLGDLLPCRFRLKKTR